VITIFANDNSCTGTFYKDMLAKDIETADEMGTYVN